LPSYFLYKWHKLSIWNFRKTDLFVISGISYPYVCAYDSMLYELNMANALTLWAFRHKQMFDFYFSAFRALIQPLRQINSLFWFKDITIKNSSKWELHKTSWIFQSSMIISKYGRDKFAVSDNYLILLKVGRLNLSYLST